MSNQTVLPTAPEGPTGQLCLWLSELNLQDVPEDARARARDIILDGLGCALVGAKLPWSRVAVNAVCDFEGAGQSPVIGWNRTLAAPAAALLNGTFIQGFELDDFHPHGPLHSASIVLPVLIALASRQDVTGKEFLRAAIGGFEVGPRVGMALHGGQMLTRGWHSGSVFGTHSAAASAGLLLGLDPAQLEDALGLAGTQSSGLMAAQYEAMCKRMHHGFAARNGLTAALLARGGYTGIKRVFEREYGGFLSVFGEGHNPDAEKLTDELGMVWETQRIALKPYAAMGALHGPLDAILKIRARRTLIPGEIEKVEIGMPEVGYHHGWWEAQRPLTPIGAQMHVGYAVSVAILDGSAMLAQFAPGRIDANDVWDLMPRVRAYHEPDFDGDRMKRGGAKVTVYFRDGSRDTEIVNIPRTISDPLTSDEVVAKFRTLTDSVFDKNIQDEVIDFVCNLEQAPSLRPLLDLISREVSGAFQ